MEALAQATDGSWQGSGAFLLILLALYLLPTIIASSKKRRQVNAICVLNLLLGWTVLGWIGALVWAMVED
jgi:hypothetical protein